MLGQRGENSAFKRELIGSSDNAFTYYIKNLSSDNSDLTVLIAEHFDDIKNNFADKLKIMEDKGVTVVLEYCNGSAVNKALELMFTQSMENIIPGSHGVHKLAEYLLGVC